MGINDERLDLGEPLITAELSTAGILGHRLLHDTSAGLLIGIRRLTQHVMSSSMAVSE